MSPGVSNTISGLPLEGICTFFCAKASALRSTRTIAIIRRFIFIPGSYHAGAWRPSELRRMLGHKA
jgi:hypothetical protein